MEEEVNWVELGRFDSSYRYVFHYAFKGYDHSYRMHCMNLITKVIITLSLTGFLMKAIIRTNLIFK